MSRATPLRMAGLTLLALIALLPASIDAQAPQPTTVIKSQHRRVTFEEDVQRIAVGDTEILAADLITSREVLVLGREIGRTTLFVWFADGTVQEDVISV